jgi:hypothetical protein
VSFIWRFTRAESPRIWRARKQEESRQCPTPANQIQSRASSFINRVRQTIKTVSPKTCAPD